MYLRVTDAPTKPALGTLMAGVCVTLFVLPTSVPASWIVRRRPNRDDRAFSTYLSWATRKAI